MHHPMFRATVTATVVLLASAAGASVLYVDPSAPPGGDGLTWGTAHRYLQDALVHARQPLAEADEVRIAAGTYRPDQSEAAPAGTLDRSAHFELVGGVPVRGGYAGLSAPDPDLRDPTTFITVLSGDYLGNDRPDPGGAAENAFHVVFDSPGADVCTLDGVTIWGGNAVSATGLPDAAYGGGIRAGNGTLRLQGCVFDHNLAQYGGAIYATSGVLVVSDCVFVNNTAQGSVVSSAGGVLAAGSASSFSNCWFEGNQAGSGSALSSGAGLLLADGCTFIDNVASEDGGTVRLTGTVQSSFTACAWIGNKADKGGGLRVTGAASVLGRQCTFSGNLAEVDGGAVYADTTGLLAVDDCSFQFNVADGDDGGAIAAALTGIRVSRSSFRFNVARDRGGAIALGVAQAGIRSQHLLVGCRVESNFSARGGGVASINVPALLRGCRFSGNGALKGSGQLTPAGGGLWCSSSGDSTTLESCWFSGNWSDGEGGGTRLESSQGGTQAIVACTLAGNGAAGAGGGVSHSGGMLGIVDSIVWGNDASGSGQPEQLSTTGVVTLDHSCVEGLDGSLGGEGNLNDDPLFADPAGVDGVVGTDDDDLRLSTGSPCIDAGTNDPVGTCLSDAGGRARLHAALGEPAVVDMGAHEFGAPAVADCDGDGLGDECAVAEGLVNDCDGDGAPDACVVDCDLNGVPDDCEPPDADCDRDGVPDACAIAAGAPDCDGNGRPDSCDLADGALEDCNGNGVPDSCDIAGGFSMDQNGNGIPDECDDCDGDGITDHDEVAAGAPDCDGNLVPDECQSDCDGDGIPDTCQIASGASLDCDFDGIPDDCQIATGAADCNNNGILDSCDVGAPIVLESPVLSPFGGASPQSFVFSGRLPPATDPVALTLTAVADLEHPNESVTVTYDGTLVPGVFQYNGHDCPTEPDTATISVPASAWNDAIADGSVVVTAVPTGQVSATQCELSWVKFTVSVSRNGAFEDLDGDGVPDDCQLVGDLDGDGDVDGGDLGILLGDWGPCRGCASDLNGDGAVDGADLGLLLSAWSNL